MKKLFLVTSFILALGASLLAQDCATGYCPANITVHHKAGSVSPQTVNITYEVIKVAVSASTYKCFITRNLGATTAPTAVSAASYTSNGWYWQFNRKQGYYAGTTSSPALSPTTTLGGWQTSINEASNWAAANDPCTLLLGSAWQIPSSAEYAYFVNSSIPSGLFSSYDATRQNGPLKFNDSGCLDQSGTSYWIAPGGNAFMLYTSTQSNGTTGYILYSGAAGSTLTSTGNSWSKAYAVPIRCVRTY